MKGTVQYGVEQAIRNCLRVQPGEKVVMIKDIATESIASELEKVLESVTPGNIETFVMEDYGKRPEDGVNALKFPDEIANALGSTDVSLYVATRKKGEYASFRKKLCDLIIASDTIRHAHMPDITEEIMCDAMSADYEKIQEISKQVYEVVKPAEYINVTTPAGTDLNVKFSAGYKWIVSDGIIKPQRLSNLPDGEVYTCAYDAKGTVVVDGVLGDYFDKMYGLLDNTPVRLEIKGGKVIAMFCDNKELLADLQGYIKQDANAKRIGEFAIGTNIGLKALIGNILQDEKFPGVHIAIGSGYPKVTGSGWDSVAHVDAVLRNVTIDVGGRVIMENGKFTKL